MITILPPPPDDAPYAEQLRYYKPLAYMPPDIAAAGAIVRIHVT